MRREIEIRQDRMILSLLVHVISWILLVTMRDKHFTIPKMKGFLILNLFILTFIYLQLTILVTSGPFRLIIFTFFALSDSFFGLLYATLNDYLYPSGFFFFCTFPKIFLVIGLYFYYDDRLAFIL